MIELAVVIWLCIRNAREARENGHRPAGYVILTIALWFGMEAVGIWLGAADNLGPDLYRPGGFPFGLHIGAYILGLLLAGAGGFISCLIASNLKPGDHVPKEEAQPPLESPAQITIARRESSALNSFKDWDVYLNGVSIGRIEDGSSLTVTAGQRKNVLTVKDAKGAASAPYVFTVGSGWNTEVRFAGGKFQNAHRTGILPSGGPQSSAAQGAQRPGL